MVYAFSGTPLALMVFHWFAPKKLQKCPKLPQKFLKLTPKLLQKLKKCPKVPKLPQTRTHPKVPAKCPTLPKKCHQLSQKFHQLSQKCHSDPNVPQIATRVPQSSPKSAQSVYTNIILHTYVFCAEGWGFFCIL